MKAVIFDLDGTLIDSAPQIAEAASVMLRSRGAADLTLEEARRFVGEGADTFLGRCLAARGLDPDETARAEFMEAYAVGSAQPPRFYDGARAALERLRAAGWTLGLCTNKPRVPTDAVLVAAGLSNMFDAVVAGREHGLKPAPEPLRACAAELGAPVETTVLVGDSGADAGAAQAAGAPFALHLNGYLKTAPEQTGAAFSFTDFEALTGWLFSRP